MIRSRAIKELLRALRSGGQAVEGVELGGRTLTASNAS